VSGRASFLGGFLGSALAKPVARLLRRLGWLVLAPVVALWAWLVNFTGSVRVGSVLLLVLLLGIPAVLWATRRWWLTMRLAHARRDRPSPAAGGPEVQCLYRWWEPRDLPAGLVCACGKPRRAGELVYIGITNNLARRSRDDDRVSACWWHVGLIGTVETLAGRTAVELAEQHAIRTEDPRENIAHAGRRRTNA
jgi:hypothetical protein